MTNARGFPRLPASEALVILGLMREMADDDPATLTDLVSYDHPRAEIVPTGAVRATTEDIARVRGEVTDALEPWLNVRPIGRESSVAFDLALGRSLNECLNILPADAAHEETWNFLSAVVFPDIVWLRFPDLHTDRLLGKRHRNTLRRAWFRFNVIGDLQSEAKVPLGEDEMTGLFERAQLARDRELVRTLSKMILDSDAPNRSQFARALLKGVTALTGTYLLDGLDESEVRARLELIAAGPGDVARHRPRRHAPEAQLIRPPDSPQPGNGYQREGVNLLRQNPIVAPTVAPARRRSADRSDLVQLFHTEMLDLCALMEEEVRLRPTLLRSLIGRMGGVEAARTIVGASHPSATFTTLLLEGRTDLTVESLVLDEDFSGLFTSGLLERARVRLGRI